MRVAFAAPFVLTAALAHADKPPKAKKGQPVFEEAGSCYTVERKEVRCPANLILPETRQVKTDDGQISFDDWSFECRQSYSYSCPQGATCNPPEPMPVDCPDALLPKLAKKVKPTRKKGKACYYGKVKVVCP